MPLYFKNTETTVTEGALKAIKNDLFPGAVANVLVPSLSSCRPKWETNLFIEDGEEVVSSIDETIILVGAHRRVYNELNGTMDINHIRLSTEDKDKARAKASYDDETGNMDVVDAIREAVASGKLNKSLVGQGFGRP